MEPLELKQPDEPLKDPPKSKGSKGLKKLKGPKGPKGLYALLTDGTRGLFIDTSSGLTLPNHTHWPIARKPKKIGWAIALLDHVVYGLLDALLTDEIKSKRQPRPFGLSKTTNFYTVHIQPDVLDHVCSQQKAVWRWHHYHGANGSSGAFKVKIEMLSTCLDKFDLNSAHCVRSHVANHDVATHVANPVETTK